MSKVILPTSYVFPPGHHVLGKYEVISPLGKGNFGETFKVRNLPLAKVSALKFIRVDDPVTHKAGVEALAQSICGHDHVVRIDTADVFETAVLIEMEYVSGGSLADRLKREFVPVCDAIRFVKHILFALEHAHAKGIIHRDVKPANILLADARAKLSDFGTAIQPDSGIAVTQSFYQPHAAPEASVDGVFSERSDVFAAAMTLLRVANNDAGWDAALSSPDWRKSVEEGTLASKMGFADFLPRRLKACLKKALHFDPSGRYQSAVEFRQSLEKLKPALRWHRLSPDEWQCDDQGKTRVARYIGSAKHEVAVYMNGRRRNADCSEHASEEAGRLALNAYVAETSLR